MKGMPNFGSMDNNDHQKSEAFTKQEIEQDVQRCEDDFPTQVIPDVEADEEMTDQATNMEGHQPDHYLENVIYDHFPTEDTFNKVPPPNSHIQDEPFQWMRWLSLNIMRGFGLWNTSASYAHCQLHQLEERVIQAEREASNANTDVALTTQKVKHLERQLASAQERLNHALLQKDVAIKEKKVIEEILQSVIKERDAALLENIETNVDKESYEVAEILTQSALEKAETMLASVQAERDRLARQLEADKEKKYTEAQMNKRFMEGVTAVRRCYAYVNPTVPENWEAIEEAMRLEKWKIKCPGELQTTTMTRTPFSTPLK